MTIFDLKTQVEKYTGGKCAFSGDEWRVNCPGVNCRGYSDLKFYFNIEKEKGHCFRCSKTVHSLKDFFKYILQVEGNHDWKFRDSFESTDSRDLVIKTFKALHENKITTTVPVDLECAPLPDDAYRILGNQRKVISMEIINYLRERGFNDQAINLIDPYFANSLSYGIILPYKMKGEIVFWIQRLFGSSGPKYISATSKEDKIGVNQYYGKSQVLWNIDSIEENSQVVICEGIFSAASVIQCGLQAIGISGKTLSDMQRSILVEKKPKKILIALDGRRPGMDNTTEKAEKMKRGLIDFIEDIKIINLPEGKDPNDLGEEFLNYV